MTEFAPSIWLGSLTASTGFVINGEFATDQSGLAVSSAGDINHDGYDDILIGAHDSDVGGNNSGKAYVVFGHFGGFSALDLSSLNGANGFDINGEAANGLVGEAVSSAGDIDGDGIDDLIVGAPGSGHAYIKFGREGGYASGFNLSSIDGANGVRVVGPDPFNIVGTSVSAAGDFNGDGYGDFVVGVSADSDNVGAYVVYGRPRADFGATLDVGDLNSSTGFRINNAAENQSVSFGAAVTSGDFDGDGLSDIVVSAPNAANNKGYIAVVYGHTGPATAIDVADLNGSNGFKIEGEQTGALTGLSLSTADINADGYADLLISAPTIDTAGGTDSGAAYVIYGRAGRGLVDVQLNALSPSDGFAMDGQSANGIVGRSISSAGDVNGDGFEDLIIGAPERNFGGDGGSAGGAYVLFGKAGGYSNLSLGAINGSNGFVIAGADLNGGTGFSVSAAGDVNGDGFDDVVVGAYGAGPHGTHSGASYVVFGHRALDAVTRIGTDLAQKINGGYGSDSVNGGGGNDTLFGWEESDTIEGGAGADSLVGGSGDDTYLLSDTTVSLGLIRVVDKVLEAFAGGNDTAIVTSFAQIRKISAGYTLTDNVENGVIAGTVKFNLTGNALANHLTGNGADNVLNGGAGVDTMEGGAGSDTYVVDDARDVIHEAGGGVDLVQSSHSYTLAGQPLEDLTLTGTFSVSATGNSLANHLVGNSGANLLNGSTGADTMTGGAGSDTYVVDDVHDVVVEAGGGTDLVQSSHSFSLAGQALENLTLTGKGSIHGDGNSYANVIIGNAAANQLDGMTGADTMTGGKGHDYFLFDTALSASNVDRITDFSVADDTIRLDHGVFTGLASGTLTSAAFHVGAAAGDTTDRIIYDSATGKLFFDDDGAGAHVAKQFATITAGLALTAADFQVV